MILSEEVRTWLENRLCGIGSYLRRQGVSHSDRRELGLALTVFINKAELNRPRVFHRFWNVDGQRSLIKKDEVNGRH